MPQFGGASEKCSVCSKTVYLAEKIVVEDKEDKKTFHKTCLKCSHCKATLSLGNYASMNGVMYCKPHFKQLFATKGNYDEGFGKEKHTTKWTPNSAPATPGNSFVPVDKAEDAKPAEKAATPSSIASRFQKSSLNSEKCEKCNKTVYATEKIVIEEKDGKKVFHKACLRCTHCQVVLTLGNYAAMNGITYCKPHLKQLFATKGNYDEGFGKEKHTTKWEPSANSTPTTFVPVEKVEVSKDNKPAPTSEIANKFKNISGSNTCDKCGKTVYLTEKVVVEDKDEKKLFHKACLRCIHCQVVLSLGNYASMDGVTYCKPHFKQLFAAKGNYDEGFGKEKHAAKWIEKEDEEKTDEVYHEKPHHEEPRHEEPRHEEHRHEEPRHEEHHHEEPRHEVHHEEPRHEEVHHEEPRHEEVHHEEPRHEEHHHEEPRHEEHHHEEERRHDSDDDRREEKRDDSSSSSSDDEREKEEHQHKEEDD